MNLPFQRWRAEFLADRHLHEFLWFCVPGVLVGLGVRAWLMWVWPYGYYHPDTHDFLVTIHGLLTRGSLSVHNKTTFLTPYLYVLAFVPKLPALVIIPLGQHLRGLLVILMVGALCRLWFRFWRWAIVPLTVLAALQPAPIFWEHTLMSESGYVFCAVGLALAGTVFVLRPRRGTFFLLLGAMFLTAAARPEGNLLLGSGVLMTLLVYGARWREHWKEIAMAVLLALFMLQVTRTSHSGLLLYASLVHLTPDEPRTVPGLGPYIRPLRDTLRERRAEMVSNDVVRTGKRIAAALNAYAADHPNAKLGLTPGRRKKKKGRPAPAATAAAAASSPGLAPAGPAPDAEDSPAIDSPTPATATADNGNGNTNGDESTLLDDLAAGKNVSVICRRLAIESALHDPWALPGIALRKFRATIDDDPGGTFEDYVFHPKQAGSMVGKGDLMRVLGPRLAGQPLDTPALAEAFTAEHYPLERVEWFNRLEAAWYGAVNRFHLPATRYSDRYTLPGVPWFYVLALLGAAAALFGPARLRRFQWAFLATLTGAWFIVTVTAAVIPRHRFVLEPFWLLYLFFLFDRLACLAAWLRDRRKTDGMDQMDGMDQTEGK